VRFVETVERLYQDGYRVFLEVGPSANLTGFVGDVLREREDVLALSCDSRRRPGLRHFQQTLAQLYVAGVQLDPAALFAHRELRPVDLAQAPQRPGRAGIRLDRGMPVLSVPADFAPPPVAEAPMDPQRLPTAAPGTPTSSDPRLALLQGHFDLMNDFLQSQSRMLERLHGGGAAAPEQPAGPAPAPLLGTVIRRDARSLEAERRFTAQTDPFLADHAIGSAPSPRQPELAALRVIPFTFSMELVAEAAAALDDAGGVLLAVEDARGHRWLALDRQQLELRTRVERLDDVAGTRLFRVRVFQLGEQGPGGAALVFEALVRRGAAVPAAPAPRTWPVAAERPIRNSVNGELYAHGMFHGPRLQGVRRLRRWGAQEIEADLEVLPRHDYFAGVPNPHWQLDPALLDAAGQLIAYWLVEQPGRWGFNCFPFRVGRYVQYAAPPPAGTRVLCRCFLKPPADDSRLLADLDFVDGEGRLLARVEDWEDRKFAVPERYYAFRLDPHGHALSEALEASPELSLRRLDFFEPGFLDQGWGVWKRMLAHMALDPHEREDFYALPVAGGRREEWLMGRLAAKDAVRDWLRRHYGLSPAPADIRIQSDALGAPRLRQVLGLPPSATLPWISISHAGRTALAACAGAGVGVDYQPIAGHDGDALAAGAFGASEQALLDRPPLARVVRIVALWSAKEAAAKASGAGLGGRPQDWQITAAELDRNGGRVTVKHQGRTHEVVLRLDGDAVTALCLEPATVLEDS
jgi:Polyketide synthase modules and related proteins